MTSFANRNFAIFKPFKKESATLTSNRNHILPMFNHEHLVLSHLEESNPRRCKRLCYNLLKKA